MMRMFLFFSMMTLAFGQGFAQRPDTRLQIRAIAKDAYVFTTWQDIDGGPYPANGLYVVTKAGVVMIDCPWDPTQFQPLLDSIQRRHKQKVLMCLATHWHDDRTRGLEFYRKQGIKTYTTLMTDVLSDKNNKPRAEFLMTRDTSFHIGGTSFTVFYPGVGHTPDNVVVWFGAQKILYGGCFIKSMEATDMGNLANADIHGWSRSIQNTRTRFGKARYVVPGHQAWGGDALLDHTLKLIREEVERRKEEDEEND